MVHRFCARALGSDADADDAAQCTMQKLFSEVGQYDQSESGLAWVLAIAAWECRTVQRRRSRARTLPLDEARLPADPHESPEAKLLSRELEAATRAALERLSPGDQETLGAVLAELSSRERPGATFRKRKQRALRRLREVWERMYGTGSP